MAYTMIVMTGDWADVSTGEVVEDAAIIKKARALRGPDSRSPFVNRWCKLSLVAIAKLAKLGVGVLETRVLLYVLSSIRDGNLVDVNQGVIARELGSHQPHVCKALANLVAANALERTDGATGRFSVYRISPHLAWYGPDNRAHRDACAAAPALCELPRRPAKPKLDSALREIASA